MIKTSIIYSHRVIWSLDPFAVIKTLGPFGSLPVRDCYFVFRPPYYDACASQNATLGVKFAHATAILNDNWIVRWACRLSWFSNISYDMSFAHYHHIEAA